MNTNKQFTILLVDDEQEILEMLSYAFQESGYTVLTASNGEEGLSLLRKQKINLVISDVRMPICDGPTFFSRAKQSSSTIPNFVFVTGNRTTSEQELLELGAVRVFSKPFDKSALMEFVATALLAAE